MYSEYVKELMRGFGGKDFEDFAAYIYVRFSKEIDGSKGKRKDKYIKIRNSILKYIAANRVAVSAELRKVK
jgi:hypothetical protein